VNHRYSVVFLIKNSLKKYIKNVVAYSERIIIFQLAGTPINMNLIQIPMPLDKHDSDTAQFYEQLRDALRTTKKNKINIILSDFNAKIVCGAAEEVENMVLAIKMT